MKFFQRITIENICYLQTFRKKTLMVSFTGQRSIIGVPLPIFEKKIEPSEIFVRINKRYIINRNFIKNVDDRSITMTNGIIFSKLKPSITNKKPISVS